jgi:hypothetical protein
MNIPANEMPSNMDYQLIAIAVCGVTSIGELASFEKTGWRRVPNARHPSIRSDHPVWLEKGGLALVERPKYLTERAREFEQAKADAQLIAAGGQLHNAAVSVGKTFRGGGEAFFVGRCTHPQSTQRKLDPKAPKKAEKRKQDVREFATLHTWRFKNWVGNKWAGRK